MERKDIILLKNYYNLMMAVIRDEKERTKFIRDLRSLVYKLDYKEEWKKDMIWEFMNGDIDEVP